MHGFDAVEKASVSKDAVETRIKLMQNGFADLPNK